MYAGGLVFQQVFGIEELWGIDFFWIAAVGLVVLTALYTIFGGMRAVLYTSVAQTPILLLGVCGDFGVGIERAGRLGRDDAHLRCHSGERIRQCDDRLDAQQQGSGVSVAGSADGVGHYRVLVLVYRPVHRTTCAFGKEPKGIAPRNHFWRLPEAVAGILFLIPGMIAFALHQKSIGAGGAGFLPMLTNGTINADVAFPTLVALLPAELKGVIVCGILAALMSSLASLFNSSASLFTIDFYKRFKPQTSEKEVGGGWADSTAVIVVLGIYGYPSCASIGDNSTTYLQDVQSVLALRLLPLSCWA